jgi:hypothetical protein
VTDCRLQLRWCEDIWLVHFNTICLLGFCKNGVGGGPCPKVWPPCSFSNKEPSGDVGPVVLRDCGGSRPSMPNNTYSQLLDKELLNSSGIPLKASGRTFCGTMLKLFDALRIPKSLTPPSSVSGLFFQFWFVTLVTEVSLRLTPCRSPGEPNLPAI